MRTQKNWDPSTCLDPIIRQKVKAEMVEFSDLAAWLEDIQHDLVDHPELYLDKDYVAATAADVLVAVERLRELEVVMRGFVQEWMDLRAMVGECPPRIKRR